MFLALILGICLLTVLVLALLPNTDQNKEQINNLCNKVSFISSLIILGIVSYLFFFAYDSAGEAIQFALNIPWYNEIFSFALGVDGISLSVMFITALLFPVIILASKNTSLSFSPKLYYSLVFLILLSVLGVFMARDLILFFIFWEVELIPTYLLLAKYGLGNNIQNKVTANKFLAFTFASGAFLLFSILGLFAFAMVLNTDPTSAVNFSIDRLSAIIDKAPEQIHLILGAKPFAIPAVKIINILFLASLIAFAIKLPSMPLHSWLINVHKNATMPILMIVAGILFIMGGYGLVRFSIEFFSLSIFDLKVFLAVFATLNIVLGGIYALIQDDMRVLLAYSNISHLGFVVLALAGFSSITVNGALFQIIAHALIAVGLVYIMFLINKRTGTFKISEASGLAPSCPKLFFIAMFFAMTTLGLPLLMGFVAESLIFYGLFTSALTWSPVQTLTIISALGIVLTAAYMLMWLKNIFFGEFKTKDSSINPEDISDISKKELSLLGIIMLVCFIWGSFPSLLENKFETSRKQVEKKRFLVVYKSMSPENRKIVDEIRNKQLKQSQKEQ